ncbi:MAG: gamma-glutamyltransferase [Gammaproteobacteria bacterium]|nr:gamma-glutamyltransferase [Gammaproteobacteria bacterium]
MDFSAYPFATHRLPMYAANGAVATSQPLAAQAGLAMLRAGGNAVDAAIATAAALTVVEPTSNGIGSDAFALIWKDGQLYGLNASGRASAQFDAQALRAAGHDAVPAHGWEAVTVPGCVDAWRAANERFGALPLSRLLQPAIDLARDGFPVSPVVAFFWARAAMEYATLAGVQFDGWREAFLRDGKPPAVGERWCLPGHAQTLSALAQRGPRDFYEGAIAERIVAFSQATGGVFSADDLAGHHSEWVQPISTRLRGYEVWEIPPNGAGIAALQAIAMMDGLPVAQDHVDANGWHQAIEAMKLAYADAARFVADPACGPVPTAALLADDYIASRRRLIGGEAGTPLAGTPPQGGTVYLCSADRDGMMVSFIQSNFEGFGSGVVVPGAGISMQNRGIGFTLEKGHLNEAAPGKRPYHTIIPGFLTRGAEALGPFGVMGGFMQPQGHLQVVLGTVDHGLNAQAVLDAPRWRVEGGKTVSVDSRTPAAVAAALSARGHDVQRPELDIGFGRGQIIWRLADGVYEVGTEWRADGVAAVY